jgi:hypothetical protein
LAPARTTWPTAELDELGLDIAITTSRLLANERDWIRRRVERFRLLDDARVQRHISVDCILPPAALGGQVEGIFVLPIALPIKDRMRTFDMRDESDTALPILTRPENATVANVLLQTQAEELLSVDLLDEDVRADLGRITGDVPQLASDDERRDEVTKALASFRASVRATAPTVLTRAEAQRNQIWMDSSMRALINLLASRFILFTRIRGVAGERRVLKFEYEERLQPHVHKEHNAVARHAIALWHNRWQALALAPTEFLFPTRGIYGASSYHAELLVPDDLVVRRADLQRVYNYFRQTDGARRVLANEPIELDHDIGQRNAHVMGAGVQPGERIDVLEGFDTVEDGWVRFDIDLRLGALLLPLVLVGLTTVTLVTGVVLALCGVAADHDEVVLLVAVPGAIAATLVPVGSERITRRLFVGMRAMIFLAATTELAAAGTLALAIGTEWTIAVWVVAAIPSLVALAVLLLAGLRKA